MARNSFSYLSFVRTILDNAETPIKPSTLIRGAINSGALGDSKSVQQKIRSACESLANNSGYKRVRTPGISGYQYTKEV